MYIFAKSQDNIEQKAVSIQRFIERTHESDTVMCWFLRSNMKDFTANSREPMAMPLMST